MDLTTGPRLYSRKNRTFKNGTGIEFSYFPKLNISTCQIDEVILKEDLFEKQRCLIEDDSLS